MAEIRRVAGPISDAADHLVLAKRRGGDGYDLSANLQMATAPFHTQIIIRKDSDAAQQVAQEMAARLGVEVIYVVDY